MRQLRVVGLGDDAGTVILEDPIRHERFSVPSDERLRAAARGDVRRLGQMEIETTSPLRPRDIQARVRAGETVAQVADGAGVSPGHVERFAYPVLLERARVAELAGRAHPLHEGRADPRTLAEIVSATFVARGQEQDDARWDAWKAEGGDWVVALSWRAGRSDNTAHWTFTIGGSGGTVAARDEHARDITGDLPGGPRRGGRGEEPGDAPAAAQDQATLDEAPAQDAEPPVEQDLAVGAEHVVPAAPAPPPSAASRSAPRPRPARGGASRGTRPSRAVPDQRAASTEEPEDGERGRGKRKNHPIVPSWEDVLLGVRSPKS